MSIENHELIELYSMCAVKAVTPADLRARITNMIKEDSEEYLFNILYCQEEDSDCIAKAAKGLFEYHGFYAIDWTNVLRIYAVTVSKAIISGLISPKTGADSIACATQIKPLPPNFHELDTFRYASSELPERPKDAEFFLRGIFEEAAEWASRDVGELAMTT